MSNPMPELWRQRARTALFGTMNMPHRILLTPFRCLMEGLAGTHPDGWWPTCLQANDLAVVQVPQGSPSSDAVAALESGHEITFIGLCGSLTASFPAGSMLEVTHAVAFNGAAGSRTWPRPSRLRTARIATVSSLADSTARHQTLAGQFDCVEMETAWILNAAQTGGCYARAMLAVSDSNAGGDVFSSAFDVPSALHAIMRLAIDEW